jgi:hypothetical protein
MKVANTILLSTTLAISMYAVEIVEYDKENGFIYYSDGSIYMSEETQPQTDNIDIVQTESYEQPIQDLEIIETIPLDQSTQLINEELEIIQTIPVDQPTPTIKTYIPTKTCQTKSCKPMIKNNNGKFIGSVKLLHVLDGKDNGYDTTTGSAYYLKAGYVTPSINGFSAKVTGYVVGDTGLTKTGPNDNNANGQFMGEKTKNKTDILKTKANIEEAYLKYKGKNLKAQVGHFRLNTPMTKNSASTVPNIYEGTLVSSKAVLKDTIVVGSHITKMAYGARALSEWGRIGEKTNTSTGSVKVYGEQDIEILAGDESLPVNIRRGKYVNFGEISGIDDTAGISIVGLINKSIQNTTIQAWEYYAYDVANITYVDGMAKFKLKNGVNTMIGAQIMHQSIKNADGNPMLLGLKGAVSYNGAKLIIAVNKSNGDAILNVWGGDPAYTSTGLSKNAYRPDVTAFKIVGKYNLSKLNQALPKNLNLMIAHGNYSKSSLKNAQKDATETDIALKYKPMKNLLFKLANVQRETEFDGYKGKDKTQNTTKFVMKYKF